MLKLIRSHDGSIPVHDGYVVLTDEGGWPHYYPLTALPKDGLSGEDQRDLEKLAV